MISRLAVFDLDGTLFTCNTLFAFVSAQRECRFRASMANALPTRALDRLFPGLRKRIMLRALKRVPEDALENRLDEFEKTVLWNSLRTEAANELVRKKEQGFTIMLCSGSADFIVRRAAALFGAAIFQGSRFLPSQSKMDLAGQKHKVLPPHQYLYVCTDNFDDLELLLRADDAMIFTSRKNAPRWEKLLGDKKLTFRELP